MITAVGIKPTKVKQGTYIKTITEGFEVGYLEVDTLLDIPTDRPIIFFHPRSHDMNPTWLPPDRIEDFQDFDYPQDAYLVFGSDFDFSITQEIERDAPYLMADSRWIKIPTKKEFKSLHGHVAAGIVLWEYYKRTKPDLKWDGKVNQGSGY